MLGVKSIKRNYDNNTRSCRTIEYLIYWLPNRETAIYKKGNQGIKQESWK